MAGKEERKKKKVGKEANKPNLWPRLPRQLIYLIGKEQSVMREICSSGVTKSWKTEASRCRSDPTSPWLELCYNGERDHKQPHTFAVPFKPGFFMDWGRRGLPTLQSHHFVGISLGLVVAKGASPSDYKLWEPPYTYHYIPPWHPELPFLSAAISSFPWIGNKTNECTVMVLTGIARPAFVFYQMWKGKEWVKKDSTIVDPHCSDPNQRTHLLRFTNGIWLKGKFYALSVQGTLALIEDIDSDLTITAVSNKRAVPSVSSKHFREYLIESERKILLILLISRNSINEVDYAEVYQLHTANLTWIKKESLGDRALFLGTDCCVSVSASRVGCRGNCIYFTHNKDDGWWLYEMETGTFTTTQFLDCVYPTLEE